MGICVDPVKLFQWIWKEIRHTKVFHFNIQESHWQEMTFLLVLPFCWWGGAFNVTFYRIFVTLRDAIKWQKGKKTAGGQKPPRKSIRKQMFQSLRRKLFCLDGWLCLFSGKWYRLPEKDIKRFFLIEILV